MSPLSRGVVALVAVLVAVWAKGEAANVPPYEVSGGGRPENLPKSINEIEAFVKKLEYEAASGGGNSVDGVDVVEFSLLPDVVADDVQAGVQEEFQVVDQELGDNSTEPQSSRSDPSRSRQLSLIYQGVYAPDARFNAFADGVMVNMVAEMKRKRMDPLYFRVYDRGIVEHVSTQATRSGRRDEPSVEASSFMDQQPTSDSTSSDSTRKGRQSGNAIGGGVIRGLTNVKRFGNAEVQVAGNTTLIRSHYVFGPLNIELVFSTDKGVKTINSTLGAVAAHAVAGLMDNSSTLTDFIIDSPAEYEIRLVGARSRQYQSISQSAILRLFKPTGKLERRLNSVFSRARKRRIPDVTKRNNRQGRRNRNRNRNKGNDNQEGKSGTGNQQSTDVTPNGKGNKTEVADTTVTPELP